MVVSVLQIKNVVQVTASTTNANQVVCKPCQMVPILMVAGAHMVLNVLVVIAIKLLHANLSVHSNWQMVHTMMAVSVLSVKNAPLAIVSTASVTQHANNIIQTPLI